MLKIRCETCTRPIYCTPVKEGEKTFCIDACREGWRVAMRRIEERKRQG